MKKYIILDTEAAQDFCPDLIGTIAEYKEESERHLKGFGTTKYIHVKCIDGETLAFQPEEIKEVL